MGKNIMVYFRDGVAELVEHIENRGDLINSLVLAHFDNTEEALQEKLNKADLERNQLIARITKLREDKMHKLTLEQRQKALTQEQRERKEKVAAVKLQWQNQEISDDEYWGFMDSLK